MNGAPDTISGAVSKKSLPVYLQVKIARMSWREWRKFHIIQFASTILQDKQEATAKMTSWANGWEGRDKLGMKYIAGLPNLSSPTFFNAS